MPPTIRFVDGKDEIKPSKATIQETWGAMESLVSSKLARSIGVSNFQAQLLYDLLRHAKIPPATLQVEHHPYLVQPLLLKAAKHEGITITAYSSFGPAGFVELDMARAKDAVSLMEESTVAEIAKKAGKTPAQVLLRWATQRGIAVIPKSSNETRMKENLASADFDIDEKDLDAISALDKNLRFNQPTNVSSPPLRRVQVSLADLCYSTSPLRSCGSSVRLEAVPVVVCWNTVSLVGHTSHMSTILWRLEDGFPRPSSWLQYQIN